MSKEEDEFNRIVKEIETKLENNPKLKRELEKNIENIETILGYQVDVTVIYMEGVKEYEEELNGYNLNFDNENKAISLSEFVNYINEEDDELELCIDPIYLKKGVNKITNVLVTTINDCVIIVPKGKKENE